MDRTLVRIIGLIAAVAVIIFVYGVLNFLLIIANHGM